MDKLVMETKNLSKEFILPSGEILKAARDININLYAGQTLGIAGESGCGKSTVAKLLVLLNKATTGEVLFHGEDLAKIKGSALREKRRNIQMIFQDPLAAFDPKQKVWQILSEPLQNYKRMSRNECKELAKSLLAKVGLPEEFLERYPHGMSGGQRQRVGIARALSLEPEILICDEVTSALDVSVQAEILDLLKNIQREQSIAIVFICHDLALIQDFSDQMVIMYLGNVVEEVQTDKLGKNSKHPYTEMLINSIFTTDIDKQIKVTLTDKELIQKATAGCPFAPRCKYKMAICEVENPTLYDVGDSHRINCHLYDSQKFSLAK